MASISSRIAYVVLAAIEEDIRSILEFYAGDEQPRDVLGESVMEAAVERRRRDGFSTEPHTVGQLVPYFDFQDGYDLANRIRERLPHELSEGLRNLSLLFSRTVSVRNRVAHYRPLEIDDLPTVLDLAGELQQVQGWDWPKINETLAEIDLDPSYIFRVSANLVADPASARANNLPSPDFDETSLLGRKEERRKLIRALKGAWPVISVLGDGGIGKTALALQVCYDLIEQPDCPFEAIVWVSAKNAQLTSTEIVRIETAVEDSLGLFASAAAEFGESGNSSSAIDDLIGVLESFPTLLVLDNVETVLDDSFPRFLQEIPPGSKVLITSRIGVKTESPFKLTGLSEADAIKLMRILAKSRGFDLAAVANSDEIAVWVNKMNCHPAYIKWFISGLQAGQVPDKLLNDNGLVLDFCMSNVFDYLTDTAKGALRAMLVVPGAHTLAEIAFLTGLDSSTIQTVILDLTRTNFVTQVRSGASGTALELSDFARAYLRRTLTIGPGEREGLTQKQKQLYAVGGGLKAAHAMEPYSVETIDVRGVGDYSAAKLLRDALDLAARAGVDEGLVMCAEAAELAPGYHEVARVEGYLHEVSANFSEAFESYSRAKDLAPEDPYIAYFFGNFLVESGFDPAHGIGELQRAAKLDPESSRIHATIAHAYSKTGDFRQAMDAAAYALASTTTPGEDQENSLYYLWHACAVNVQKSVAIEDWPQAAEDVEFVLSTTDEFSNEAFIASTLDTVLLIEDFIHVGATEASDDFIARRIAALAGRLRARRTAVDTTHTNRKVGVVETLVEERGFGFLRSAGERYFFHARQLWNREKFSSLTQGAILIFTPGNQPPSGKPEATFIHWIL